MRNTLLFATLASAPVVGLSTFTCCSGQVNCGGGVNDPSACSALGDLYSATNGNGWTNKGGWSAAAAGTPTDICSFWQSGGTPCAGGVLTQLCARLRAARATGTAVLRSLQGPFRKRTEWHNPVFDWRLEQPYSAVRASCSGAQALAVALTCAQEPVLQLPHGQHSGLNW